MSNLMKNLRDRLKAVSIEVWLVCALAVLAGGWLIAVITKPPSAEQLQRRADLYYEERYNNFFPGEAIPDYDGFKMGLVKRDGRYFLIPRDYWSAYGFTFYWPLGEKNNLKKHSESDLNPVEKERQQMLYRKSVVAVYMKSWKSPDYNVLPILNRDLCIIPAPNRLRFRWRGIVLRIETDSDNRIDWPRICQHTLHILDQIQELKA